jgi:inorganic pyrophosphatase/exopolyphosphatase
MSSSSTALRQFLKEASSLADEKPPQQRVVVLGNESGDLDSVAASIALSFLLASSNDSSTPQMFAGITVSRNSVLPVLNFRREDITLRKDVSYVLAEAGIDISYVVCIDDISLQQFASDRLLQLLLVDHNVLCPSQAYAAAHVIACVDHHADSLQEASPQRCIRSVGSCCSIVTDLFAQHPQLGSVAFLLAAAITIDTKNLTSPVTTDTDVSAMRCLRAHLDSFDDARAGEIFLQLQQLRQDVSGLAVSQLFLKDMKQFLLPCGVTITFSSLPVPITTLGALDRSWTSSVLDLILARGWHALLALSSVDPASGLRSVAILARDDAAAARVCHLLRNYCFELNTVADAGGHRIGLRNQIGNSWRHAARGLRFAMGGQDSIAERSCCKPKVTIAGMLAVAFFQMLLAHATTDSLVTQLLELHLQDCPASFFISE